MLPMHWTLRLLAGSAGRKACMRLTYAQDKGCNADQPVIGAQDKRPQPRRPMRIVHVLIWILEGDLQIYHALGGSCCGHDW
jgi:hypothetical protein